MIWNVDIKSKIILSKPKELHNIELVSKKKINKFLVEEALQLTRIDSISSQDEIETTFFGQESQEWSANIFSNIYEKTRIKAHGRKLILF